MGKESISRTTFVKGLAAGIVLAASLGILSIGEYSLNAGGALSQDSPADGAPSAAVAQTEDASEAAATETSETEAAESETAEAEAESGISVSVIGGADGPTSVFLAGKAGTENESETESETQTEK